MNKVKLPEFIVRKIIREARQGGYEITGVVAGKIYIKKIERA